MGAESTLWRNSEMPDPKVHHYGRSDTFSWVIQFHGGGLCFMEELIQCPGKKKLYTVLQIVYSLLGGIILVHGVRLS